LSTARASTQISRSPYGVGLRLILIDAHQRAALVTLFAQGLRHRPFSQLLANLVGDAARFGRPWRTRSSQAGSVAAIASRAAG